MAQKTIDELMKGTGLTKSQALNVNTQQQTKKLYSTQIQNPNAIVLPKAGSASGGKGGRVNAETASKITLPASPLKSFLTNPIGTISDAIMTPIDDITERLTSPSKKLEQEQTRLTQNQEMADSAKTNVGRLLGGMAVKAADDVVSGVAGLGDMTLGTAARALGWENNPFHQWNALAQATQEANREYYSKNTANAGKLVQTVDELGTGLVEALPQLAIAYMTAGGSLATEGAGAIAQATGRLAGTEAAQAASKLPGAIKTAQAVTRNLKTDPQFWTSFSDMSGRYYNDAKAEGADDWTATMYALATGIVNAGLESGGGVQKLPGEMKKAEKSLFALIKSAHEEGTEEPIQGIIERASQNLILGKENPLFSLLDENAVFNPKTAAKEYGSGFAIGGILGAGPAISQGINNRAAANQNAINQAREMAAARAGGNGGIVLPMAGANTNVVNEKNAETEAEPTTASTSINTDPATHTPEQMNRINQYIASTNTKFLTWLNKVQNAFRSGDKSADRMKLVLDPVGEGAAAQVKRETGIDATGFSHMIDGSAVRHIEERHGASGEADSTMRDVNDIARAIYVVENSDSCELIRESDGTPTRSVQFMDKNNRPAPLVKFAKQIDGIYYVVEAVPDSADKKLHIASAYMQTNGGSIIQELDMSNNTDPQPTPEAPLGPVASAENSVSQTEPDVKTRDGGLVLPKVEESRHDRQRREAETGIKALEMLSGTEQKEEASKTDSPSQEEAPHNENSLAARAFRGYYDFDDSELTTRENGGIVLPKAGGPVQQAEKTVTESGNTAAEKPSTLTNLWTEEELDAARKLAAGIYTEETIPEHLDSEVVKALSDHYAATTSEREYALGIANGFHSIAEIPSSMNAERVAALSELYRESGEDMRAEKPDAGSVDPALAESPAMEKLGVKVSKPITEVRSQKYLIQDHKQAQQAKRQVDKAIKDMKPTRAEKEFAKGLADGTYTQEQIPQNMSPERLNRLADLYRSAESYAADRIGNIRKSVKESYRRQIEPLIQNADQKEVPSTLWMNLNTLNRVFYKIFGQKEGRAIAEELYEPVLENSAEKIRFINRMFDRVRGFHLTDTESELVQRVMEGNAVADQVAKLDPDLRKRVTDAAQSKNLEKTAGEMNLSRERIDLARRYQKWLETQARLQNADADKINRAAKAYTAAYNDFYDAVNDFLVSHGYEPIGFIKGYAPHLQPEKTMTALSSALQRLGIDTEVGVLPTEIAGRTDAFRPGKQWNPYFLHRMEHTGDNVQYDAVKGFESYVNYMGNVLYHTDDIMKFREFTNMFREKYAPSTVKDLIDQAKAVMYASAEAKEEFLYDIGEIGPTDSLTEDAIHAKFDAYVSSLYSNVENMSKYGEFVTLLENYTNKLAGKQTFMDRALEKGLTGRMFLNLGNQMTKIFGQSTIVGNLSSALNQTAQLPMAMTECGVTNVANAIVDIIKGETKAGEWSAHSDFLTGKRGVDYLSKTEGLQKAMDVASVPFEAVDDFASQVIVRAKYLQEVKNGASTQEAMRAADQYANKLVGSRIQGAKPMLFENKNIITKAITTFQLEAANGWAHLTQDVPAEIKQIAEEQGTKAAAGELTKRLLVGLISAFLWNRLSDELYGGTPSPYDLIGITMSALGESKGLTTNQYMLSLVDNLLEDLSGERKLGTEELPEETDWSAAAKDARYTVTGDVPFLNNLLSFAGLSDSNKPLPRIPKDTVGTFGKAVAGKGTWGEFVQALAEEGKTWLPMGNQLYKTVTGARDLVRGGSFSGSGKNEQMRYQLPQNALTAAQALMFGSSATNPAKEWRASGYDNLSKKETAVYRTLADDGVSKDSAYDLMRQIHGATGESKEEISKKQRDILRSSDLTDDQKRRVYRDLLGDSKGSQYKKFTAMRNAGMNWDQIMDAYEKYREIDATEADSSAKATQFAAWVDSSKLSEKQREKVKDQLKFWNMIPAKTDTYDKMHEAGLSAKDAQTISDAFEKLEPEEGKESVSYLQKYKAIVSSSLSESKQAEALIAAMGDNSIRFEATQKYDVTAKLYVTAYDLCDKIEKQYGKTQVNAGIAKAAIDSIPNLSVKQRAALWQVQYKGWKGSSNPYDKTVGWAIYYALHDSGSLVLPG